MKLKKKNKQTELVRLIVKLAICVIRVGETNKKNLILKIKIKKILINIYMFFL